MRPVPDRSHILKTCPTKAGPPTFPLELSPPILTVEGNPERDSEGPCSSIEAEDLDGGGSARDSNVERGGS